MGGRTSPLEGCLRQPRTGLHRLRVQGDSRLPEGSTREAQALIRKTDTAGALMAGGDQDFMFGDEFLAQRPVQPPARVPPMPEPNRLQAALIPAQPETLVVGDRRIAV